jgi:hypothetical protein
VRIPFGIGSYKSDSLPLSAQGMVNCYAEKPPPNVEAPVAVWRIPGCSLFASATTGGIRGAHKLNGTWHVVSGTTLYSLSSSGTLTSVGTIPGTDRVFMADNGIQMLIVSSNTAYLYASSVVRITDPDFPGAIWGDFIDGYFVFVEPNSGRLMCTALYDGSSIDALDFATAESSPDNIKGGIIDYPDIVLFGEETSEVWFNSGNTDFPFERSPQGVIKAGIAGRYACAKEDNTIFFLDHRGMARRLDGYTPVRISTHAIEVEFKKRDISTCKVFAWVEDGHTLVSYKFSDGCFVYDVSTELWHERGTYGSGTWLTEFIYTAYGKALRFDSDGRIGEMSRTVYAEYGNPIVATCVSPAVTDKNKLLDHNNLQLLFETGVGLTLGQGSLPEVMLRWSDDSGRTWSNTVTRSLGPIGEYKTGVKFDRIGRAKARVYEWSISDPVKLVFMDAFLNAPR